MSSQDNSGGERGLREKILSVMQSIGRAPSKRTSAEEVQKLRIAASRLDQMLKASADADAQTFKNAIIKLDQYLQDISQGKDYTDVLKRRRSAQHKEP